MPRKELEDGAMGSVSRTDHLNGIIKESPNRKNLLNSAKTTRGDCGPSMANQDVVEVKPPSMPGMSFSMESGGMVSVSDLKPMQVQGSSFPLDPANFSKKHSALQAKSKSLQKIAQHWLWKAHDTSKTKGPVCEKFELEAIDSTINSSLFDDPPYEKDEISFSDPPSCCGESAAEKYVGMPPDVQQNNSINCDFGDWPQSGDSSTKALYASRRTKRSLKPSKRQPNLGSGDQKPEVNSNVEYTIPQNLNCVTRGVGEVRMSSQTQPEINVRINQEESLTKVEEEEGEKSYSSSSKLQRMHLDDSYSSGPESEQLCKRLRCLKTRQGVSLLSIHEDDVDDWSAVGARQLLNQTPKTKNRSQIARSPRSPPGNHASREQSLGVDEQFNCCNAYADPLVSSRQTCLLQNDTLSLNSQSQEMTHPYYLNSSASTSSNVCKDVEFDRPQTYVQPKSNASLPELNGHKDKYNTFHRISSLSSFFDAFPCAEAMWRNPSPNNLKRVFERPRNESEALSQRTYVIAKIDLAESFGARTYSIPSNTHSEVDDAEKKECLKQHNNNATNETPRVDFALPGVVKKPPSFLSLIKEARAANMIPPSLSTPSYSWEKKEFPEDDCMTLPARRSKQQEQQADESRKKITPKHEMKEGVVETKSTMPSPQVNQNSTTETKAITASQAIENAKGTVVVDYKERRRLRQQKELEEARKEVLEATRSALRDRIAFNKKEGNNTSSPGVSKTLFCGSTKAMFNPDASLGDIKKFPEKVEEEEVFKLEPVAEEPKTKTAPCATPIVDVSKMEVEKVAASKSEESPKKELESTPLQSKSRKKTAKKDCENKNANVPPPNNMQIVPVENALVKPMQGLAMPSQMIVPVPVGMPQCGMMLPFSFPQYSQPNFYYIQNPWEFMEHRSGVQRVYISETSSSGSTSSRRYRRRIRSKPRRREESSSFSSFSETSSFSSDTTFSTDSELSESLSSLPTSATSSSDRESTSSTSSFSDTPSRVSLTTSHSSSLPPTTARSSDSSSRKD
ncbi:hypothetical protein TSMEX_000017 [Taenia solium]|eukprot:TsM_000916800 transcript=TsM_000916800 gene=TsM_000916800